MQAPSPISGANGYRPDIDGLRGVAVLAVLFYHFKMPGFTGGFVGVDIFFVISGYLITRIVADEISAGRFSILGFYERRVRRLFPALFVLLAAVTVACWFLLMPREFRGYATNLLSVILFASNIHLWLVTANYFGAVSETLPLLHTWSLAVEEQYYLAFPIFLLLVLRFGRKYTAAAVALLLLGSLGLAAWMVPEAPTASFYLPVTRAWELLLGALLALGAGRGARVPKSAAAAIGLLGFALIAGAIAGFKPWTPMPGPAALIPCGGAALAIFAGEIAPTNPATRLFGFGPLVGVGLISYSLYLWHWPVYVLLRHYVVFEPLDLGWTLAAMATAFAAAFLSWRFVERPVRRREQLATRRALFTAAAAGALLLIAAGAAIRYADGFPGRFAGLERFAPRQFPGSISRFPCPLLRSARDPECLAAIGKAGPRRVLVWGDSYAGHYRGALAAMRGALPFTAVMQVGPGCPPVLGFDPYANPACRAANDQVPRLIEEAGVDTVILAARWEAYRDRLDLDALSTTIATLRRRGLTVILFGQTPVFHFQFPDGYHYSRVRMGAPAREGRAANSVGPELNAALETAAAGAYFFDPAPALCNGDGCLYRENDHYLFRLASHLRDEGARKILDLFLASPEFGASAPLWRKAPPRSPKPESENVVAEEGLEPPTRGL